MSVHPDCECVGDEVCEWCAPVRRGGSRGAARLAALGYPGPVPGTELFGGMWSEPDNSPPERASLWNTRAGPIPGLPDHKIEGLEDAIRALPEMVTPDSPPERVHRFWIATWWPVASVIVATGADCTVLDPDAEASESLYDGHPDHGVVTVHPHSGLGWTITVSETETVDDGEDGPQPVERAQQECG